MSDMVPEVLNAALDSLFTPKEPGEQEYQGEDGLLYCRKLPYAGAVGGGGGGGGEMIAPPTRGEGGKERREKQKGRGSGKTGSWRQPESRGGTLGNGTLPWHKKIRDIQRGNAMWSSGKRSRLKTLAFCYGGDVGTGKSLVAACIANALMEQTVESIKQIGVVSPLIARPDPEGGYEILSGHRRLHAAQLAGLETVPVIVKEMDDDAAIIFMVDSNLQRENILPSERAFSYKMKLDAMKHQGTRNDLKQLPDKLSGS